MALTRLGLVNRIRLDEAFNDTGIVSDASLYLLLTEATVDLCRRGKAFILNGTIDAVASQQEYVLSGASPVLTNFLDIDWEAGGIYYKQTSTSYKYHPVNFRIMTIPQLDMEYPGWRTATATDSPIALYTGYNSSGYLVLGAYPAPESSTPDYVVHYLGRGTDMSGDTHYPFTGSTTVLTHLEPFHPAIAYYCLEVLYRTKIGGAEGKSKADEYLALYLKMASEMKESQERLFYAEDNSRMLEAQLLSQQSFGSL